MYSSFTANSSAAITSSSFQNKIVDSENDIKETKIRRSYGMNLSDLSMKTGSTLPLNEDSNEPLLEGTVNTSQFTFPFPLNQSNMKIMGVEVCIS